ncbi:hypothetical protein FB451DRAFT_1396768 [Mycena latifolia]|nr:hypothetical protein FB451DRAFT_1396768 [Mycena latifolia]
MFRASHPQHWRSVVAAQHAVASALGRLPNERASTHALVVSAEPPASFLPLARVASTKRRTRALITCPLCAPVRRLIVPRSANIPMHKCIRPPSRSARRLPLSALTKPPARASLPIDPPPPALPHLLTSPPPSDYQSA